MPSDAVPAGPAGAGIGPSAGGDTGGTVAAAIGWINRDGTYIERLFAGMVILSLRGVLTGWAIRLAERRLLRWRS